MKNSGTSIASKDAESTLSAFAQASLELVWPSRCVCCERRGELVCKECESELLYIDQQFSCASCGAPYGHIICTECYSSSGKEVHPFSAAIASLEMSELSGRIVVRYKDSNERRLSQYLAHLLANTLPLSWLRWTQLITWVPADKRALKQRGFDHMELIALELAKELELPYKVLLKKHARKDQRKLKRQERFDNLTDPFTVMVSKEELPSRVLLIDDVHTTGATLCSAAQKLKEAGAGEVRVASIVRAW